MPNGKANEYRLNRKKVISASKPHELFHLDLFVPSRARSLGCNYYEFVIVDDFSRFTWTLFLTHKDENFMAFVNFVKLVQNIFDLKIITLCSDHDVEFVNHQFQNFCNKNGIAHNFSCLRTP